jgi:hypothetical protein
MPGSLGHEVQDAKTFASWVLKIFLLFFLGYNFILSYVFYIFKNYWNMRHKKKIIGAGVFPFQNHLKIHDELCFVPSIFRSRAFYGGGC